MGDAPGHAWAGSPETATERTAPCHRMWRRWVKTHEEQRVLVEYVNEITNAKIKNGDVTESYGMYTWDIAQGVRNATISEGSLAFSAAVARTEGDPQAAIKWLDDTAPNNTILILKDYHNYVAKNFGSHDIVNRMIRNSITTYKALGKVLVILSPIVDVPIELDKEVSVLTRCCR